MDRFEYLILTWTSKEEGPGTVEQLDILGRDDWEAVGITTRSTALPMPGMGASIGSDVIVLLKRQLPPDTTDAPPPARRRPLQAETSG